MFKAIAQFFQNLFKSPALLKFEEFCSQVFTAEKALVLSSLKNFAIQAATTAESTGLDSTTKRSQAFASISAQAQTAGIVVGASMIGLALEMAVQAIKGDNGNKGVVS